MKLSNKLTLILGLLCSNVNANENSSPIDNIEIFTTELSTLSIQNLSKETVEIDIYGETINLIPASGVQFECSSYENLELQFKNNDHEYFETPCQARIVISELFTNQYAQGK